MRIRLSRALQEQQEQMCRNIKNAALALANNNKIRAKEFVAKAHEDQIWVQAYVSWRRECR